MISIMNLFTNFIKSLTFMDYLFLSAIFVLIILMIIMIYYLKLNQDTMNNNENINNTVASDILNVIDDVKNEEPSSEVTEPQKIEVKDTIANEIAESVNSDFDDEEGELLDLESLTEFIKQKEVDNTSYNEYEKEQEERAIISYDELLARANRNVIKYLEDKQDGNDIVKRIDVQELVSSDDYDIINETHKNTVALVSYEKEEEFLETLKKLQSQLIN